MIWILLGVVAWFVVLGAFGEIIRERRIWKMPTRRWEIARAVIAAIGAVGLTWYVVAR